MLKKCLKYDLQSVSRIWWILAATMMGAALVAALSIRAFFQALENSESAGLMDVLSIFGILGAGLCLLAMVAGLVISVFLVYWRTYTHFYTDEGYLTFTLPVKRSTLYLSKVLTSVIVETATLAVFLVGIGLILLIAPPADQGELINPMIYEGLGTILKEFFGIVKGWPILWGIALIPTLLASQLYASGLVFMSMSIGAMLAKKHKLMASIGIYYAITAAVSFVGQFFSAFLSEGIIGVITTSVKGGGAAFGLTITAVILIWGLLIACATTVIHFITVHLLEKKLNLA